MINLKNAIKDAVQIIEETTNLFYRQKNQEGYQKLDHTLNTLMSAMNLILSHGEIQNIIDEQKLNAVLGNAMSAIEKGDTILLSDILIFELKPLFEDCYNRLS